MLLVEKLVCVAQPLLDIPAAVEDARRLVLGRLESPEHVDPLEGFRNTETRPTGDLLAGTTCTYTATRNLDDRLFTTYSDGSYVRVWAPDKALDKVDDHLYAA